MKENPFDRVMNKTLERVEKTSDKIARNFKGVNPFDKEQMPDRELIMSMDMLTPEELQGLIDYHGYEVVNELFGELEAQRTKREMKNA